MRIIGGELGGRKIEPPKGSKHTRPTSDRMRESIFNKITHMLDGRLYGKRVADIFAGTGAMGLEAISRGALSATFVEKHAGMELIKRNAQKLGVDGRSIFLGADARTLPQVDAPFDVIFMDPPYGRGLAEPALLSAATAGWLKNGTLIVIEIAADDHFETPVGFIERDSRAKGVTRVLYLEYQG